MAMSSDQRRLPNRRRGIDFARIETVTGEVNRPLAFAISTAEGQTCAPDRTFYLITYGGSSYA